MAWDVFRRIWFLFAGRQSLDPSPQFGRLFNKKKGNSGELEAYRLLRENGYRVVARNYRRRFGEIDLIAWDNEILAFVEVKTRLGTAHGRPEEAVNRTKQKQICRVANEYRACHRLHDINYRFDIVSILRTDGNSRAELIKGAFQDVSKG